jgi:hypothetical protein
VSAGARARIGVAAAMGVLAWSFDLLASYALVHTTRETGRKLPLAIVSGASLAVLLGAATLALVGLRRLPAGEPSNRTWRRLGACVLVLHGFLLLVLVGQAVPKLLLAPWD